MEAVKEWLRGLVLLVVLASLLELLLPMGSMKRFVRMTMGLLIILGVVRPVVGLLGQELTLDPALLMTEDSRLPTVDQIMTEAGRFRARNEQLLLREAEGRLGEELQEAVRRVAGGHDASVEVRLAAAGDGEYRVEGVKVTLRPGRELDGTGFGKVQPVAPVRVGERTSPDAQPAGGSGPPPAGLVEAIRREVAAQLGLEDGRQVEVVIVGVATQGG